MKKMANKKWQSKKYKPKTNTKAQRVSSLTSHRKNGERIFSTAAKTTREKDRRQKTTLVT